MSAKNSGVQNVGSYVNLRNLMLVVVWAATVLICLSINIKSYVETTPVAVVRKVEGEAYDLDKALTTIINLQNNIEDDPQSLEYKGSFDKADSLLKAAKTLMSNLQIGFAAASAAPTRYCQKYSRVDKENSECELDRPIEMMVTIVLNLVEAPPIAQERLPNVLQAIQKEHPNINVHIGIPEHMQQQTVKDQTINIKWMRSSNDTAAELWNKLVSSSPTPYVLVARDLLHYDKNAFLEKQVKILLTTGAVAAGGATRNIEGYWRVQCYQMSVGVYTLKFEDGYRKSVEACMKCDYIGGPFIIEKKDFQLNSGFRQTESFIAFFFQLLNANSVSFVCPEVMYYQKYTNLSSLKDSDLKRFGRKESFDTFPFPEKTLELSCSAIKADCRKQGIFNGVSLPRCCPRAHVEGLTKLFNYLEENNSLYYIRSGILVTSVKIRDIATWDGDSDIQLSLEAMILVNNTVKSWLKKEGFTVKSAYVEHSKLRFTFNLLYKTNMLQLRNNYKEDIRQQENFFPEDNRLNLTKVYLNEHWFVSLANPALYAKTNYGNDYLRHKHRRNNKRKNGKLIWLNFKSCPSGQKQVCMNLYPSDGNLDLFP